MKSRDQQTNLYRRVSIRIWGDAKFRALSKPLPNAQTLWFHLLFGEQTDIIPGLFRIGEAAFAEQLGWPIEGFRSAFAEVERSGMVRADVDSRLIYVPKAIEHNAPQSPNVVKSWRSAWQRLPECELKDEAWQGLKAFLEGLGDAFVVAFYKACPSEGIPEGFTEGIGQSGTGTGTGTGTEVKEPDLFGGEDGGGLVEFSTFVKLCKESNAKTLPNTDAVFAYAERIKLPIEFLRLAWREFSDRQSAGQKRYKGVRGWRQAFGNCVRDNWYHLWFVGDDGQYGLTTAGQQAKRAHAEKRVVETHSHIGGGAQ